MCRPATWRLMSTSKVCLPIVSGNIVVRKQEEDLVYSSDLVFILHEEISLVYHIGLQCPKYDAL